MPIAPNLADIADRLFDVRALKKALKAEEEHLRTLLLEARVNGAIEGTRSVVTMRTTRSRILQKDLLPAEIQSDPAYWKERVTTTVLTRPTASCPVALGGDLEVQEPY